MIYMDDTYMPNFIKLYMKLSTSLSFLNHRSKLSPLTSFFSYNASIISPYLSLLMKKLVTISMIYFPKYLVI